MYLLFAALGLAFGSFASVVITRVPQNRSILGRSHCPQCKKKLAPWELLPLVSYCVLQGRCRSCRHCIGILYPFLELSSVCVFVFAAVLEPPTHAFIASLTLALACWFLFVISVIDLRTRTISDALNIPFVALAALHTLLVHGAVYSGMVLAGIFFGVLFLLGRGRWIGSGDIILGIGIGALLGTWQLTLVALMITYIVGAVAAILLLLTHVLTRKDALPFAPLLAIGAYAALALQPQIESMLVQIIH